MDASERKSEKTREVGGLLMKVKRILVFYSVRERACACMYVCMCVYVCVCVCPRTYIMKQVKLFQQFQIDR